MKAVVRKGSDFTLQKFIEMREEISGRYQSSSVFRLQQRVRHVEGRRRISNLEVDNDERGDVPGWVLVVLMTTGLVTAIWTIAAPRLSTILRNSLDAMKSLKGDEYESSDEGSVEAGLTLIPTTAFFLLVMQLVITGSFQVMETIDLQSTLRRTALFGSEGSEFAFAHSRIVNQKSAEIPGGGELLIAESVTRVPTISSLAPKNVGASSHVIVVRE
jgi:hypothetical protein